MSKYIPFLKCKSNEIMALKELGEVDLSNLTPFFDFPRPKSGFTTDQYKASITRLHKSISTHVGPYISELYFDTYDVEQDFEVDGSHYYSAILKKFDDLNVIPVVSLDRSSEHIKAVYDMKLSGMLSSDVLAIRLTLEDFESYKVVEDEIHSTLSDAASLFNSFDIVFDCRICSSFDEDKVSEDICKFASAFSSSYPVRRTVITGSSIPPSARDVLPVNSECTLPRKELSIFKCAVQKSPDNIKFTYGDYTTVSPEYSDADIQPEIMQNVMTAKLTYTHGNLHYFIRGNALKTGGRAQYFDMAKTLCSKAFFRGAGHSSGDAYFEQKSQRLGSNCAPGTVIKPSVNSHMAHVLSTMALQDE